MRIANSYSNVVTIPEVMPLHLIESERVRSGEQNYYILNDLAKSAAAKEVIHNNKDQVILIDRYFVSTLAYLLTERVLESNSRECSFFELYTEWYGETILPDRWIFIEDDPRQSWMRSYEKALLGSAGWTSLEFVEIMDLSYRKVFLEMQQSMNANVSYIRSSSIRNDSAELDKLIFSN
ncbi:hypothetical protein [Paenibacillus sp. YYML68]|uniref:hypothetical protein n=1 Tax=Paenibacillus sp. YYML68 TaxID=2909250 RepID=UPI002492690E|nr:hypothetical protein [Paenibacillus sp. YYML68]